MGRRARAGREDNAWLLSERVVRLKEDSFEPRGAEDRTFPVRP